MSTLNISAPRTTGTPDVDARFNVLVRSAVPAQRDGRTAVDFENVFDLDYGQVEACPSPSASRTQVARRVRVTRSRSLGAARRAVRITRRGRVVLVLAFVGMALALMTAFGGWATATLSGGTPEPVRVIEVAPGDTLYGIAAELAQPGEIRSMVHRIQELNSLPGAQISEGQKLAVPRG